MVRNVFGSDAIIHHNRVYQEEMKSTASLRAVLPSDYDKDPDQANSGQCSAYSQRSSDDDDVYIIDLSI